MIISYDISELIPYINWSYFFVAWQVKEPSEKDRLRQEAEALLQQLEGEYHAYGLFELFDAHSDGDDIVVGKKGDRSQESGVSRIPCLRQQQGNPPYLCLSDFLPPQNISTDSCLLTPDSSKLGVFATSVSLGLETDFSSDPYQKMMAQLLADRLAEAAAERMHEQVRKEYWVMRRMKNSPSLICLWRSFRASVLP